MDLQSNNNMNNLMTQNNAADLFKDVKPNQNILNLDRQQSSQHKEVNEDNEKLKQRREDNAIEIRKDKRQKELNKKRQMDTVQLENPIQNQVSTGSSIVIQDQQLKAKIDVWLKQTFTIQQNFEEILVGINGSDIYQQHYAVIALRKILSVEDGPPIQPVIDANLIPKLIEFTQQTQHQHLQLEAAWALTNVASGTSHQTQAIIDKGGISIFCNLLRSPHHEIAEQAIWALGNIAGDCAVYRDMILKSGGLDPLIKIINNTNNRNTVKHGTWALSNLCRGRPLPDFELVKNAIPTLSQVIIRSSESEVLTDAAWALSYLSDGDEDRIDMVLQTGVVPALSKLLQHSYLAILIPALRTLGNIVTGNAQQTNQVINEPETLNRIFNLLNHEKRSVRREACWTLSNITAGTADQISVIIKFKELVEKLKTIMETDCSEIVRESTWVLSNATSQGSPQDVYDLVVNQKVLESFINQLSSNDTKTIAVVLEAINNILNHGKNNFMENGQNQFRIMLENFPGAVEKIEELQEHENEEVYKKSLRILEDHFPLEECI